MSHHVLQRPYERCPECRRESLEVGETGEYIYRENVEDHQGKQVVCGWGCGQWLIPGDPKQFATDNNG